MDNSHSSLYALNDQSSGTGRAFNIHVMEHLQSAIHRENDRTSDLEKELASCKKRLRDLEAQLQNKNDHISKGDALHQTHLRTVKDKLLQCLRLMNPSAAAAAVAPSTTLLPGNGDLVETAIVAPRATSSKVVFEHRCDECNFRSKSVVSLILHKINHSIVEQQYLLSSTAFTTRNSNSKAIYNCPACDEGTNLTRHEVYRHI